MCKEEKKIIHKLTALDDINDDDVVVVNVDDDDNDDGVYDYDYDDKWMKNW